MQGDGGESVDAGKHDKAAQREGERQRRAAPHADLQLPYQRHRDCQDHRTGQDVDRTDHGGGFNHPEARLQPPSVTALAEGVCGAEVAGKREGNREVDTPGTEGCHIFSIGMHWKSGTRVPTSIKPREMKPVTSTNMYCLGQDRPHWKEDWGGGGRNEYLGDVDELARRQCGLMPAQSVVDHCHCQPLEWAGRREGMYALKFSRNVRREQPVSVSHDPGKSAWTIV